MKLYRSLVYRELKLTWKHMMILLMLSSILCGIILSIIGFVMQDEEFVEALSGILALVTAVASGGNNGIHKADINAGWKRYSYVLPVTSSQKALTDLMVKLIYIALFGMILVGTVLFTDYISGYNHVIYTVSNYLAFSVIALFLDTVYSGILLLASDRNSSRIIGIIASLTVIFLFNEFNTQLAGLSNKKYKYSLEELMHMMETGKVMMILLMIFAFLCLLYYFVIRRVYERRDV